jgi:hypothetical protein
LLLFCYVSVFDVDTDAVPIYDGRKHQLKVPDDLRNIPSVLSRYDGQIPYHSLVLVAYTVSLYRATQGPRKDQPTVPFNISFAVVLYDEFLEVKGTDSGEDAQDGSVAEEEGDKAVDETIDGKEVESNGEEGLSDVAVEE